MKLISIQNNSGIPKYRQIIASLEKAILDGKLLKNDRLPSVNKVCLEFGLSRDTVLLAYDELKKRGIILAIPAKGYYVKSTEVSIREKIFLLFDELNSFKEDLYNSFLDNIGKDVQVDISFHHFNPKMFSKLIEDNNGIYTKYVIMPANLGNAAECVKTLPPSEVFILDQTHDSLSNYPSVYQNFVTDIYNALKEGKGRLDQYGKLILIFPGFREPEGMKQGFLNFCADFGLDHEVISEFDARNIEQGEVYILPNDRDLVKVIEQAKRQRFQAGIDFGIISYNETPLKKLVESGITTISTDFLAMGKLMAKLISEGRKKRIENKCSLILRNSL
ncbi:GntR family transcriptional regulator [Flavobacterium sp. MAH-1]|uniref:GntR family transcriptional regulator n=1 Tax=Flavobacterium agri TaxID=2743471 RepID=A0A7Y8Y0X0_9FLAO|nr:GntR family transcriptional regulator [Flavobacterium agri]NUY80376.1 GntR family transcriptional regulator [Flavobacterium agri]NYA70401.1 GntR family transcriptional regulator [Flavobacterium agri]